VVVRVVPLVVAEVLSLVVLVEVVMQMLLVAGALADPQDRLALVVAVELLSIHLVVHMDIMVVPAS
jgi:hypothetical protein